MKQFQIFIVGLIFSFTFHFLPAQSNYYHPTYQYLAEATFCLDSLLIEIFNDTEFIKNELEDPRTFYGVQLLDYTIIVNQEIFSKFDEKIVDIFKPKPTPGNSFAPQIFEVRDRSIETTWYPFLNFYLAKKK